MGLAHSDSHSTEPRLVETPTGPVEYVDVGSGPPLVFVHGSPGGCDQGVLMTRFLAGTHRVIAVSRPGYLGTPLGGDNRDPAAQAALVRAVLDSVGIDRFGLMCWSGGGPVAYSLAASVPERVSAIVAVAAVSTRFDPRSSLRGRLELTRGEASLQSCRTLGGHDARVTCAVHGHLDTPVR
ncbi:alpha/beta fold hydrolase [Gordonia hongkongensis]|uniref:alpha/beta fold hydrolase n=1 Tax=Gordonia hongkongensis TaxID=1701090 RepID=UPI003EB9497C